MFEYKKRLLEGDCVVFVIGCHDDKVQYKQTQLCSGELMLSISVYPTEIE